MYNAGLLTTTRAAQNLFRLRVELDLMSLIRTRTRTTEALAGNERHCWWGEAMRLRNGVAESRAIVAQQRVGLRIRPPRPWNDHCSCSHGQGIVGEILVRRFVWVQTPFSLRFASTTNNFFTFLDVRMCSVSYWLGKS